MRSVELNADLIDPLNPVDEQKVQSLESSMRESGWLGRPLLVEQTPHGYVAWTGSHRIWAARRTQTKVPCLILEAEDAAAFSRHYDRAGCKSWREAVTKAEGPYDENRLRGLRKPGVPEAAAGALADEVKHQQDELYQRIEEEIKQLRGAYPHIYASIEQRLNSRGEEGLAVHLPSMIRLVKLRFCGQPGEYRYGFFSDEHRLRLGLGLREHAAELRPMMISSMVVDPQDG